MPTILVQMGWRLTDCYYQRTISQMDFSSFLDFTSTYSKLLTGLITILTLLIKTWLSSSKLKNSTDFSTCMGLTEKFFADGHNKKHPLLVENSFAAIMGHKKLSALEIEAALRQDESNRFINDYLSARPAAKIISLNGLLNLQTFPKHLAGRLSLQMLYIFLYKIFSLSAFWFLAYKMPEKISSGEIKQSALAFGAGLYFVSAAIFFLLEGRKLAVAKRLKDSWK